MVRNRFLFYCALSFFLISTAYAAPKPPQINARSAILIDAETGNIIYEKNSRSKQYPASTTKIMTAILALEKGNLNDELTVSEKASNIDNSSMHLKKGEKIKLDDMIYGLMLRSANDGAVCIAEYISGSEEDFVKLMNAKAKKIGAYNTNFVNPNGLHDDNHYTTAYDMAIIAGYAIKNPAFNEYVKTKRKKITRSINTKDIVMQNTAHFLWKYNGADGIKTGFTKKAGRCFIGSATRDGWRIICIILGSDNAGKDTIALMDFGYKFYKKVSLASTGKVVKSIPIKYGTIKELGIVPRNDLILITRKTENNKSEIKIDIKKIKAPIKKGSKVGTLTAFYGNKQVGSTDLLAMQTICRKPLATFFIWARNILIFVFIITIGLYIYGTAVAKAARCRRRSIEEKRRKLNNIG